MILLTTPASIDSLCNVCVQAEHNFLSVLISVNWPWCVYVYIFINRVYSFFGLRSLRMIVKLLWNSLLDAFYWANQIDGPIPNLENKQKSALNRTFLGFFFQLCGKGLRSCDLSAPSIFSLSTLYFKWF